MITMTQGLCVYSIDRVLFCDLNGLSPLFLEKGRSLQVEKTSMVQSVSINLCQYPKVYYYLSIEATCYTSEDIFTARNCEATIGMIISKLFNSLAQQLLKRRLIQV